MPRSKVAHLEAVAFTAPRRINERNCLRLLISVLGYSAHSFGKVTNFASPVWP
jgi:hypothetical protein